MPIKDNPPERRGLEKKTLFLFEISIRMKNENENALVNSPNGFWLYRIINYQNALNTVDGLMSYLIAYKLTHLALGH